MASNSKYILAIDQGTTGTKSLIVDEKLKVVAQAYQEFPQIFPKPGWVEHQPEQIWKSVVGTIQKVIKKVDSKKIVGIGITNQRETICFWDRMTGKSLSNAIVWQDRRTAQECQKLLQQGTERFFQENTGLVVDPYFSGTKVAWALKNWPQVKAAQKKGRLCVGTIDSYLIHQFSQGTVHATEPSNASRTLCYHLTRHQWDSELCASLGVPKEIWPEVRPSTGTFATTQKVKGLPSGIPISGVLGDQQAALLGNACIEVGAAKCTYGTGAFLLMNTGDKPARSQHRLVSTIAWSLQPDQFTYALEGSAFIAGAAVQWLRDGLKLIKKSTDIEALAQTEKDSGGVVFVPALTGLGAPYWNPEATGMFTGISRGSSRGHLARAVLEGIAYQNADILNAMQKDMGSDLSQLNVDGGASANNLLMQFQADLLGKTLIRPKHRETTVLGAVFAAGLGVGLFNDIQTIKKTWKKEKEFSSKITAKEREGFMKNWADAIARVNLVPK